MIKPFATEQEFDMLHSVCQYWEQISVDVLLTVHLSIFISVFNQLDAQNFVLQ